MITSEASKEKVPAGTAEQFLESMLSSSASIWMISSSQVEQERGTSLFGPDELLTTVSSTITGLRFLTPVLLSQSGTCSMIMSPGMITRLSSHGRSDTPATPKRAEVIEQGRRVDWGSVGELVREDIGPDLDHATLWERLMHLTNVVPGVSEVK